METRQSASTERSDDTVAAVQEEARALAEELRPGKSVRVQPDSQLDRDLQFDSLARAELLMRLERAFDTELPEQLLASSETLQDLADAIDRIGRQRGRASPRPVRRPETVAPPTEERPEDAQTLIDVLDWHVQTHPERVHVALYGDGDEPQNITYGELWEDALQVAARLQQRGLMPQQTVAIMLPTGREYLASFFGVLLAGGIPVPIYPPARMAQIEDHIRRHAGILANARAVFLITVSQAKSAAFLLRAHVDTLQSVLTPEDLRGEALEASPVTPNADDIAFLQYTSGSTGNPKGVVLTHHNLMANIRAMVEVADLQAEDAYVSWLPLYHDMGLIASWLGSLYFSVPFVLMSPLAFVARPHRWLWAIHNHRGTLSGSPNFGYELCVSRIRDKDIEGLDLSSWRVAYNGAEPISPETMRRFIDRFRPYGFREEAMMPVYGLAECSVGLTCHSPGRGVVIDRIQREPFMTSGRAIPAEEGDENILSFPSCGWPLPGHEIRVVDAAGMEVGDRQQGRLEFRGPSATSGYYRNAEQTRKLFHDDWLDSQDLAYIADGELYVTGRVKDLIIRAGRNIHPQELEQAVGELDNVRRGCVAVFACADPETRAEKLVVLAETRLEGEEELEKLKRAIDGTCVDVIGMPADDIVLVPPQTVPKTSSGKIRRAAARSLYERPGRTARRVPVWMQMARLGLSAVGPEIRQWRRSLARLLYSGYAWTVLVLMGLPIWLLIALSPVPRWNWRLMQRAARLLLRLWRIPFSVHGEAGVPSGSGYVVVANHASYFDGLFLIAAWPQPLAFVAKAELRDQLVAGTLLKRLGVKFVERFDFQQGVEDASRLVGAVHTGQQLMLFPEGTFTRAPGLAPFRMGAFTVAAQTKTPVVPVAIRGTRSLLRAESWRIQRQPVSMVIGGPIAPQDTDWNAAVKLRDEARAFILRHCREPDLAR